MLQLFRRLRARGLRASLLGVVVAAVFPLVGLLFVYTGVQDVAAQDRAHAEIQRSLLNDVLSIQDLVAESRATLLTFGITYAIQGRHWALAQGNADRLKAEHPDYAVIAVADPTGRILVSSTDQTGSVNVADRDFFKHAVSSRELSVSDHQLDPVVRHPTINVSYPVFDADGKLIAVEYIGFDPDRFSARLTSTGFADSVAVLIDGNGTVVARKPALPGAEGKSLRSEDLVRTMFKKKRGNSTMSGLDGVTRRYFFAQVFEEPQGTLYLASGFSETGLLAGQRRSFKLTLLGFGAFALLALALAWSVGTFSIYVPIRKLEDATARLSGGTCRPDRRSRSDVMRSVRSVANSTVWPSPSRFTSRSWSASRRSSWSSMTSWRRVCVAGPPS